MMTSENFRSRHEEEIVRGTRREPILSLGTPDSETINKALQYKYQFFLFFFFVVAAVVALSS